MVSLSALDRDRFGVVVARSPAATSDGLGGILDFCRENGVELLVARCDAADYRTVHALEEAGGRLMDGLVYFSRSLAGKLPPLDAGDAAIRPVRGEEARAVQEVAERSFRGYLGHYHTDPRLDRARADETYADWAYRSCLSREVASEVLVAEQSSGIVGFITLRLNGPEEAEIVLNGVAPEAQRGGVYRRLLLGAMGWARALGAARLVVSTQLTNYAVQKAWVRAGFEPLRAHYTFHLWFSRR